jgi:hypothetical protein
MKMIMPILVMIVCSVFVVGQRKIGEDDPQWRQETVQRAFSEVSAGMATSWSVKYLARLGDRAAPEITSYLASKHLTSEDAETALSLVKMSFAIPRLIIRSADKTPTDTLILLDYLDTHTSDAHLKLEINSEREQLQPPTR